MVHLARKFVQLQFQNALADYKSSSKSNCFHASIQQLFFRDAESVDGGELGRGGREDKAYGAGELGE